MWHRSMTLVGAFPFFDAALPFFPPRPPPADQRAHRVGRHLVEEALDLLLDQVADALLTPGDAGGFAQTFQQIDVHGRTGYNGETAGNRAPTLFPCGSAR